MQPDLVIFDCDGVLIDSEIIACAADAAEFSLYGRSFTAADMLTQYVGISHPDMIADLTARFDLRLPHDIAERLQRRLMALYRTDLKAIAGVHETLSISSWKRCVASSSRPSTLALGLVETGLFDFFYPSIYSTSLVGRGKPAPDIFMFAAAKSGAMPEKCVVVEDSPAGIAAARAAGMRAIGFVGGTHCDDRFRDRLLAAGAEIVVQRFPELHGIINGL